jgi:tetratricopeptide (TPR) repeat protein
MTDFPELPRVHELTGEEDERRRQRFTRLAAAAIVLITLAAASTAYLQTRAMRTHEDAASLATELATAGVSTRGRSDQAAQMLVDRYDVAQQQRARAAAAEQQALFGPTAAGRTALVAERTRWLTVARETERNTRSIAAAYGLPPITADSSLGPAGDRFFPSRYLAASRREADRLGALRDAANQQGDQAESQIGRYGISLTVFAVAVFLFGYSLTPHARQRRRLFAGSAAAFAVAGCAWTVSIVAQPPQRPPDRAASAFADGRVAFDSERYALAVRAFTRSIAYWPDYAEAYVLRARAEFAAGSPQLDVPLSLTTAGALAAATRDEQRAIELGSEDSGLLVNAGYQLFYLGLLRNDAGTMERGLHYSREAAQARPTDPVPQFNVGVTLLALGRLGESRAAYADAVSRTIFVDRAHRVRRNDTAAYEFNLASALTDLASLAARRGRGLNGAIALAKLQLVSPITRAAYDESLTGRGRQDVGATGVTLDVGPAFTHFAIARPTHIDVNADLSAQWYYDAPGGLGWEVLPDVSGAVNGSVLLGPAGSLFDREGFLSATGSCLSPGSYRLELYDNGRKIAQVERQIKFPQLVAGRLRELGLALCRPAQWRPITGRAPGLLDGYTSPDRRAGMVVFSLSRQVVGAARPSPAVSRRIMAAVLHRSAGALPSGLDAGHDTAQSFMGLPSGLVRTYRYPGGIALAGAGAATDTGQLLVAVAFGPPAFFATGGHAVFASLASEG